MRCYVCVCLLMAVSRAAPAPEGYGAPPLLPAPAAAAAAAEERRAAVAAGAVPATPAERAAALDELEGGYVAPGLASLRDAAGRYNGLGLRGLGVGRLGGYSARRPLQGPGLGPLGGIGLRRGLGPLGEVGLRRGVGLGVGRYATPLPAPAAAAAAAVRRDPLLLDRLANQGNPPQLRPDGLLDGPGMPYSFNWAVDEPEYGNFYGHQEESDGVVTQGEYRVLLPDGRLQIVTYSVEGDSGYQAQVRYEGEAQFPPPGTPGGLGGPAPFRAAVDAPLPPAAAEAAGRLTGPLGPRPAIGGLGIRPLGLSGLGRYGSPFPADVDPAVEEPSTTYGYN